MAVAAVRVVLSPLLLQAAAVVAVLWVPVLLGPQAVALAGFLLPPQADLPVKVSPALLLCPRLTVQSLVVRVVLVRLEPRLAAPTVVVPFTVAVRVVLAVVTRQRQLLPPQVLEATQALALTPRAAVVLLVHQARHLR